MSLWDVGAWRILFPRLPERRVHFLGLFWIRLAGEALNNITPFLDVGGEPLKARMVSQRFRIAPPSAMASVVVAKTSSYISEAAFMFFGAVLSFKLLALPDERRIQLCLMLVAVCAVFTGFLLMQQRGAFRKLNPEIGHFYTTHGDLFWSAATMNMMGWVAGGVETYFFCRLVGMDITVMQGVVLEALMQLVRTGSFFIPMNLGAQEGGFAFFIGAMGYAPVSGVAVSLLKRMRQLLWTGVGFVVWAVFSKFHRNSGEIS